MSVIEGLKIQIHVYGSYVLSVWFTLLIGFGSVWIFSRINRIVQLLIFYSLFLSHCIAISSAIPQSFRYLLDHND